MNYIMHSIYDNYDTIYRCLIDNRVLPEGDTGVNECAWVDKNASGKPSPGIFATNKLGFFIVSYTFNFLSEEIPFLIT